MKQSFFLNQVITTALIAGALIGVAIAGFNYQGRVDFNLGTNGVNLKVDGGKQK